MARATRDGISVILGTSLGSRRPAESALPRAPRQRERESMKSLAPGARLLPTHHITIRVPWHDGGWAGAVCTRPLENTSCLILPRIGEGKRDEVETRCAGQRLDELSGEDLPPCAGERVSFMAPFELAAHDDAPLRGDLARRRTGTSRPRASCSRPYSAACVPFRWMLRGEGRGRSEGQRDRPGGAAEAWLDARPRAGPDAWQEVDTAWVQERDNQLALLDTFFGALRPEESLCFFYAKRTPLSEQSRRVIIGVGRVLSVGQATEYAYSVANPPLRCVLWERNVGPLDPAGLRRRVPVPVPGGARAGGEGRGDRPGGVRGLRPGRALRGLLLRVRAPDATTAPSPRSSPAPRRCTGSAGGSRGRGTRRCAGSTRSSTGSGRRVAHSRASGRRSRRSATNGASSTGACSPTRSSWCANGKGGSGSPWELVDAVMEDPARLGGPVAKLLSPSLRKGWKRLAASAARCWSC